MQCRFVTVEALTLFAAFLSGTASHAQAAGQDPSTATPSATQPSAKPAAPVPNSSKPAKVWTNENLADANGPVSVVGDPKKPAKGAPGSGLLADPTYIANTRKQLEKLQTELADTDKKLTNLKDFLAGESVSYSGYQYRKGYDREPVDAQIRDLEEKKKQTQAKIDKLLEEARKKGVEPGQLR